MTWPLGLGLTFFGKHENLKHVLPVEPEVSKNSTQLPKTSSFWEVTEREIATLIPI